jgi:hypothetical protein
LIIEKKFQPAGFAALDEDVRLALAAGETLRVPPWPARFATVF